MKKTFVLDTNVLLHDPESIFAFAEHDVVIPIYVLEEIDRFKREQSELGRSARQVSRNLDGLREFGSLHEGVDLPNGGLLIITYSKEKSGYGWELGGNDADSKILAVALDSAEEFPDEQTILVTKDINLRIRADALGLDAEDYETGKVDLSELHSGFRSFTVPSEALEEFNLTGFLPIVEAFHPNEFILLQCEGNATSSALGRYSQSKRGIIPLVRPKGGMWGICPRNKEQAFAIDLLMDDSIQLVTLVGRAGTGKTLVSIAAALHKVTEERKYHKVLVSRPVMPLGKDVGFLPGTLAEKMLPWMQPIFDNVEVAMGLGAAEKKKGRSYEELIDLGILQIEPLTYIRGRSIPGQFMLLDECFPYKQKILTDKGKIRIGDLHERWVRGKELPKAMAFNEETQSFEYRQILNAPHKGRRDLCKVTLGNRTIVCTPNHPLLTTVGWKKCDELQVGDYVKSYGHTHQSSMWLNDDQLQVVVGSYLGDGSLSRISNREDEALFRLKIQHGAAQTDYLQSKMEVLRPDNFKLSIIEQNGYSGKPAVAAATLAFGLPTQPKSDKGRAVSKSTIDKDFVNLLNVKGLAIWFMDDGSKFSKNNGGCLHTESMDLDSCEFLAAMLLTKFDLHVTVSQVTVKSKTKTYNYLRFNKENYLKLCKLIAPYVFPSMSYKIFEYDELGGGTKVGEFDRTVPKFSIVPFRKIEYLKEPDHVFDLEVEGLHNFIALGSSGLKGVNTGIIAHNCQNLSPHEIKTVLTRVGEGTKIVLTGDPYQIDNPYLDAENNGLVHVVNAFRNEEIAGHVTLTQGERSPLSELAANLL